MDNNFNQTVASLFNGMQEPLPKKKKAAIRQQEVWVERCHLQRFW